MSARLQVMKFGGTSVGDAACIARAAQIVAKSAREGGCVAVVSAMSGVTNRLIAAARRAETGDQSAGSEIISALRAQHEGALKTLIREETARQTIFEQLNTVFDEA